MKREDHREPEGFSETIDLTVQEEEPNITFEKKKAEPVKSSGKGKQSLKKKRDFLLGSQS